MSNIPGPISLAWTSCKEIAFTPQQPSNHFDNLIYMQQGVTPSYGPPMNQWTVADAKAWGVPGNSDPNGPAQALFLAGLMGITGGTNAPGTPDVTLYLRKLGDTTSVNPPDYSYIGQTNCSTFAGDGSRCNFSSWIALVDGQFEWAWWSSTTGNYPTYPSYFINVGPQVWVR